MINKLYGNLPFIHYKLKSGQSTFFCVRPTEGIRAPCQAWRIWESLRKSLPGFSSTLASCSWRSAKCRPGANPDGRPESQESAAGKAPGYPPARAIVGFSARSCGWCRLSGFRVPLASNLEGNPGRRPCSIPSWEGRQGPLLLCLLGLGPPAISSGLMSFSFLFFLAELWCRLIHYKITINKQTQYSSWA